MLNTSKIFPVLHTLWSTCLIVFGQHRKRCHEKHSKIENGFGYTQLFFLGSACQTFYHLPPLDFRNMQMTFVSLSFNKSIHSPFKALGLRNPFNLPFTTLAKMFENVSVKAHLKAWMDPGEKWFLVHFLPESFLHTCTHFSTHVPNFKSGLPFLQLARLCRRRRRHFKRSISRN